MPPVKGGKAPRRVNFGWAQHVAVDGSGPQTLPREVTFNAELGQLQWLPPVEIEALRGAVLANVTDVSTSTSSSSGGSTLDLELPPGAGKQTEVLVSFRLPEDGARLSVLIMAGDSAATNSSEIFVEIPPSEALAAGNRSVRIGVVPVRNGAIPTTT